MIGRVEHFKEDLKYLADGNNFTSLLSNEAYKLHLHPSGSKRFTRPQANQTSNKEQKIINYLSLLSSTQLGELYSMYKIDFEMFGYTEYPYVK